MHGSGSSVDGDAGKFADSIIISGVPNRPEPGEASIHHIEEHIGPWMYLFSKESKLREAKRHNNIEAALSSGVMQEMIYDIVSINITTVK